jgi:hypothetical protein
MHTHTHMHMHMHLHTSRCEEFVQSRCKLLQVLRAALTLRPVSGCISGCCPSQIRTDRGIEV